MLPIKRNKRMTNLYKLYDNIKFPKFYKCQCCCEVTSVVSNSVQPHRQQPTRLPHPWDSPGKNTGVGCHFLLQCMKVKSESEVAQSCPTLSDPMYCSLPAPPSMGLFRQEYRSGLPLPSPDPISQFIPFHPFPLFCPCLFPRSLSLFLFCKFWL